MLPRPSAWAALAPMGIVRHLLWIDCTAAALAGGAVLLLAPWLGTLHGLPPGLLTLIGVANLLYGGYSFSLAIRGRRPQALVAVLVVANAAWSLACVGMAVHFWGTATGFGLVHLVGEAVFVGGLAASEWVWRQQLLLASGSPGKAVP